MGFRRSLVRIQSPRPPQNDSRTVRQWDSETVKLNICVPEEPMKKEDYQKGRKIIREDMERLVNRYLEEIICYKEELTRVDLARIEKSKEAAEKTEIRNAKLLALLEIQEITNQMIKELNTLV
jgi:hypothetical protein